MTKEAINMDDLAPAARKRVRLAIHPRDKVLSLRFTADDVGDWKVAADVSGESLTDWMEHVLNAAAKRVR